MDKRKIKINNIIADSIHLLYEKGYNGVGIQEIVESANIPKGSFYAYFKNKEDYLLKSLDFFYSKMEKSILLPLEDKITKPLNRINNFYQSFLNLSWEIIAAFSSRSGRFPL